MVDREGNPVEYETESAVAGRRSLSNTWKITFNDSHVQSDRNQFTLQIQSSAPGGDTAETSDGHRLFRTFLIHIDVNRNLETDMFHPTFELAERAVYPQANALLTTLNTILDSELVNIRELTAFEEGL